MNKRITLEKKKYRIVLMEKSSIEAYKAEVLYVPIISKTISKTNRLAVEILQPILIKRFRPAIRPVGHVLKFKIS